MRFVKNKIQKTPLSLEEFFFFFEIQSNTIKTMKRKLALHWKILSGIILGLLFGFLMKNLELNDWVVNWIKPFGTVFINLLKMIAVPLIIVSLIVGLADLKDISKLSRLGGRTVLFYLGTTFFATLKNVYNQKTVHTVLVKLTK